MISDTSPEIRKKQLEMLRKLSGTQRLQLAVRLTSHVRAASRKAIERLNPTLSPRELEYKFIELHYGRELAEGVRASDARRSHA